MAAVDDSAQSASRALSDGTELAGAGVGDSAGLRDAGTQSALINCTVGPRGSDQAVHEAPGGLARAARPMLASEGPPLSSSVEPRPASSRRTSIRHGAATTRHGHRIPVSQYLCLGAWFALLFLQYACVRFVCRWRIPEDCKPKTDMVQWMEDMQYLMFPGFVLAVMTGMHWPDRFEYIFSFSRREPRGWWFLLIYLFFGFFWSCLHLIPGLGAFTLTKWRPEWAIPLISLGIGSLLVVGWHFWAAYKYNSKSGFAAYVLSRLALLAFYSAYLLVKVYNNDEIVFHFHHYAFGLMAASLAEFNHAISLILLATCTAVFVQGLAAYGADPVIRHPMVQVVIPQPDGAELYSPLVTKEAADFFTYLCAWV